jgi:hypothetical protein
MNMMPLTQHKQVRHAELLFSSSSDELFCLNHLVPLGTNGTLFFSIACQDLRYNFWPLSKDGTVFFLFFKGTLSIKLTVVGAKPKTIVGACEIALYYNCSISCWKPLDLIISNSFIHESVFGLSIL